jgi:glycosyl transferase family 25
MVKGFIIYKSNDKNIESFALNLKKQGLKYNFELDLYPGIYSNIEQQIKSFKWYNQKFIKKWRSMGVAGCFLSHFSLWKKCIELNQPVAIFEYDAELNKKFSYEWLNPFTELLHLDYASRILNYVYDFNKNSVIKEYTDHHIRGAHAYIITPLGAKKVINDVYTTGWMPADIQLNNNALKIEIVDHPIAQLKKEAHFYESGTNSTKIN